MNFRISKNSIILTEYFMGVSVKQVKDGEIKTINISREDSKVLQDKILHKVILGR